MKKFKARWEIDQNWQLIIPLFGFLGLLYSAYKITGVFVDRFETSNIPLLIGITLVIYYILLKITLFCFIKLENRWMVERKWEMISIFLVFAITGSSSVFIGRPILRLLGITKDNLNITLYWVLYVLLSLIFYKLLLVCFGWLFGQFKFFLNFVPPPPAAPVRGLPP